VIELHLELGSGYSPTPGYTHLDANPETRPDIVGLAFPLPDEVHERAPWESIRAVDVLEHLSYRDTDAALRAWAGVLKPGGRLYVQVPDADTIMRWYCDWPHMLVERIPTGLPETPLAGAAWRLLGGHRDSVYAKAEDDWRWNAHYSLWSIETLTKALGRAGMHVESMERNGHPNLLCWSVKS
jgi:SAM-dependent methyltransferase